MAKDHESETEKGITFTDKKGRGGTCIKKGSRTIKESISLEEKKETNTRLRKGSRRYGKLKWRK